MEKINQELINFIFEYKEGKLFWKNKVFKFNRIKIGEEFGNGMVDRDGYKVGQFLGKQYRIHRLIYFYHFGYFPEIVDHKDGNIINNNIENLRECNIQQSNFNRKVPSNSKVGVKGVYKRGNKWVASCKLNKVQHYLGTFNTLEEAKQKAIKFREEHHGEFCNHGENKF